MTADHLPGGDANLLWARQLLAELYAAGVRALVLAPGSRSAPLTLAAASHGGFSLHQHFDERALGFFALGLARRSARPVGLICTSGTAVANLLPAVVEADLDDLPLLLLTADRPPELIDCGANQAIRQQGLFGQHLRACLNLPPPTQPLDLPWLAGQLAAVIAHQQHQPGPVQINVMLREPLYPSADMLHQAPPAALNHPAPPVVERVEPHADWWRWSQVPGVVVAGRLSPTAGAAVADWAAALGWPLLADPQSHARHGSTAITPAELALADGELVAALLQAPLIIRCGDRLTGKRLNQLLADHPGQQWQVVPGPGNRDPQQRVSWRSYASVEAVVAAHPPAPGATPPWLEVAAINQRLADCLPAIDHRAPLDELSAVAALASLLPADGLLLCGNSLPIRLLDQLAPRLPGLVHANRGASGIDGLLATACGAGAGHDGPLTALIGDISLLHDLNSLALLAATTRPSLLLLLNNGGGNIFDLLPVPDAALRERYFRTPVSWQPAAACATFGLRHCQPNDLGAFITACQQAWQTAGATVVEVVVPAGTTAPALRALGERVARAQLVSD